MARSLVLFVIVSMLLTAFTIGGVMYWILNTENKELYSQLENYRSQVDQLSSRLNDLQAELAIMKQQLDGLESASQF
jgi:predicted PurR-regulated permease PerM